jgi:glutathione S-transferase
MSGPHLHLYHFPGACSFVSRCALEEAGLSYTVDLVNLRAGAQYERAFLAVSPLGKVPTLLIDGAPLTENAAILVYLAALRPEAGLLPPATAPRDVAEIQSGLSFCGATLHPQVRGLASPMRLTAGDVAPVRERAMELAQKSFAYADARIAERTWWLGEWSVLDLYLHWAHNTAIYGGFPAHETPHLSEHGRRLQKRDAVARVTQWDVEARQALGL